MGARSGGSESARVKAWTSWTERAANQGQKGLLCKRIGKKKSKDSRKDKSTVLQQLDRFVCVGGLENRRAVT